jgi:hypothetical protein
MAVTTVEVSDELRKGLQAGYGYLESVLRQIQSISSGGWLRIVAPASEAEHQLRGETALPFTRRPARRVRLITETESA